MKSFNLGTDGEMEWHYGRGMEGETRGENSLSNNPGESWQSAATGRGGEHTVKSITTLKVSLWAYGLSLQESQCQRVTTGYQEVYPSSSSTRVTVGEVSSLMFPPSTHSYKNSQDFLLFILIA